MASPTRFYRVASQGGLPVWVLCEVETGGG